MTALQNRCPSQSKTNNVKIL